MVPPHAVTEDMNGAKTSVRTCYKCKKDGHVRCRSVLMHPRADSMQITRDCTEGHEAVVEEEDTAWAEVREGDDPWGNSAVPIDGT